MAKKRTYRIRNWAEYNKSLIQIPPTVERGYEDGAYDKCEWLKN